MNEATLEPGRVPDDTWGRHAQTLPPDERAQLLGRADVVRDEPGGTAVACACYRLLRDDLDPARELDMQRLIWLLRHAEESEPTLEEIARHAADAPRRHSLWIHGQLCLARLDRAAGRIDEGIWRMAGLMREVAGRNAVAEGLAAAKLALMLSQQGRAIEAYLVSRRAVALLEGTDEHFDRMKAKLILATAYVGFVDWDAYERTRASVIDALETLPPDRQREIERGDLILRLTASAERGEFSETLSIVDQLDGELSGHRRSVLRSYRSYLLVRLDRAEEARRLYDELVAGGGPPPPMQLRFETTDVLCSAALDPPETARARLESYLAKMEGTTPPGERLELLRGVCETLVERKVFPDLLKRAYDLGAACTLERLVELDTFARQDRPLFTLNSEERRELGRLRTATLDHHGEQCAAVVRLLAERRARGDAMPGDWYQASGVLSICAWCSCVRHPDGTWVPVGSFLPSDPQLHVSHGICPDCEHDFESGL